MRGYAHDPPPKGLSKELVEFLDSVPDYRRTDKGNFVHTLRDILLLELMARLAKCVMRKEIIDFGKRHLAALRKMGILAKGVPSEPTLCRVSKKTDSQAFAEKMHGFVATHMLRKDGDQLEIVAVDGKCMRGTALPNGRQLDIVSAHSVSNDMTICTEMCEEKSNEIKTDPSVIEKSVHEGDIVTLDAMGCQENIIKVIKARKAHFLIEVKANQKKLRWGVEDRIKSATPIESYTSEPSLSSGRISVRRCKTYSGVDVMVDKDKWGAQMTVVIIEVDTMDKSTGRTTCDVRMYITDLTLGADILDTVSRLHWGVEVTHWHLDYNMKQDGIKRKHKNAAMYLDTIQRLCLNVLSKWRSNRKKKCDKTRGNAELMRKCLFNFAFIKELLSLK